MEKIKRLEIQRSRLVEIYRDIKDLPNKTPTEERDAEFYRGKIYELTTEIEQEEQQLEDADLIKRMDEWLRHNINDEDILFQWFYTVPDEVTPQDCIDLASDPEEMARITKKFAKLVMADMTEWRF